MRGINREDTGNKLCKVLLQLNEIAIVEGGDASFQYFIRDKFADVGGDVCRGGKLGDDATEDFDNHCASSGVAHAEGMCAEQNKRFEDYRSLKDEGAGSRPNIV